MANLIYKYELDKKFGFQLISMPHDATILSIKEQDGNFVMWALIDAEIKKNAGRIIQIIGTGHTIEETGEFIDTIIHSTSGLVFHFFEMGILI